MREYLSSLSTCTSSSEQSEVEVAAKVEAVQSPAPPSRSKKPPPLPHDDESLIPLSAVPPRRKRKLELTADERLRRAEPSLSCGDSERLGSLDTVILSPPPPRTAANSESSDGSARDSCGSSGVHRRRGRKRKTEERRLDVCSGPLTRSKKRKLEEMSCSKALSSSGAGRLLLPPKKGNRGHSKRRKRIPTITIE